MAVIGSWPVMVSSRGTRCRRRGATRRARSQGGPPLWLLLRDRQLGYSGPPVQAEPASAAVGRVLPRTRQPGDDRGAATPDDQGEPAGQLPDHVRGGHVVAGGVVLAADLPRRLPAQRGGSLQGGDV